MKHSRTGARRRLRQRTGFTLVEVMIALVLLLGIATALINSMTLTFGTKEKVLAVNDRYHEGRQVLIRIARELRMGLLIAKLPEEAQVDGDPTVLTQFKGEEDEIFFATTAHLRLHAGTAETDQCEVAYMLKRGQMKDSEGFEGKTLYRRESRLLDDKPDRGGAIWPMVQGVKEFKLEYWDDSKEIGDDAWQSDWDSDDNDLLPKRVRITLVLESGDGRPDIRLMTQAAPKLRRPIIAIDDYRPGLNKDQLKQVADQAEKAVDDLKKQFGGGGSK